MVRYVADVCRGRVEITKAHYRVAHALLYLGKNEEAKQVCETALQAHADDVVRNLGNYLLHTML
jgi:Tfp pilus assembly protein PilF